MKRLLPAFAGALVGGVLAVLFGSASAIREANDRAHQAREVANGALAQASIMGETIAEQLAEIGRLKAAKGPKSE